MSKTIKNSAEKFQRPMEKYFNKKKERLLTQLSAVFEVLLLQRLGIKAVKF